MGIFSTLVKPYAFFRLNTLKKSIANAEAIQNQTFEQLLSVFKQTEFGKDRHFKDVQNLSEFRQAAGLSEYENIEPYIEKIKQGKPNQLWRGMPVYFAKTSGTTSGAKYIPITKDSIGNHVGSATLAAVNYSALTNNWLFLDHKMIFLSGSPELDLSGAVKTGRLSGIVNHHVPGWLRLNQLPSYATNCIENWEEKLDAIITETLRNRMGIISGIPPWVQMYFDKLQEKTGKRISEIFPDFQLFMYGGVNFNPYKKKLYESIGKQIDSVELYPASEGFFAFQDIIGEEGMLLLVDQGIFYEFIPTDEYFKENPTRLTLSEVKTGVNYAMVISTNAGLCSYVIGDTVKFVSTAPHRVIVSGRLKHYISAFGEHVIQEEVEKALAAALADFPEASVVEFSVAPKVNNADGLPCHEWFIEFDGKPNNPQLFSQRVDAALRKLNIYYDDLVRGNILQPLNIVDLPADAFKNYMKSIGKLGGQNKVPRLSNDRKIAEGLLNLNPA